jgi:MFS family permease
MPERDSTDERLAEPARALLAELLRESREEVVRADTKASIVFGLLGVALGVVLAGLIAGDWSPAGLRAEVEWLFWVGAAASLGSMVLLGSAIWPRITHLEDREEVAYFGHVAAYRRREQFREAVLRQSERDPDGRTVDQVHAISGIAMRKYRLIQLAIVALALAAVCCLGAVMFDAVTT